MGYSIDETKDKLLNIKKEVQSILNNPEFTIKVGFDLKGDYAYLFTLYSKTLKALFGVNSEEVLKLVMLKAMMGIDDHISELNMSAHINKTVTDLNIRNKLNTKFIDILSISIERQAKEY